MAFVVLQEGLTNGSLSTGLMQGFRSVCLTVCCESIDEVNLISVTDSIANELVQVQRDRT
jgi:hypothetical protein